MSRILIILIMLLVVAFFGGCGHIGLEPERFKEIEKRDEVRYEVNVLEDHQIFPIR